MWLELMSGHHAECQLPSYTKVLFGLGCLKKGREKDVYGRRQGAELFLQWVSAFKMGIEEAGHL